MSDYQLLLFVVNVKVLSILVDIGNSMTCSDIYYDIMATSYYTKVKNENKW